MEQTGLSRTPATHQEPREPGLLGSADAGARLVGWCAAIVGLLAVIVRAPGAVRDAFWQDEIASVHVLIQPTPWSMIHQIGRNEGTPPVWYALGWLVHQVGISPQGYRTASVLAGGVLAAVTVMVAVRVLPLWAAAAAGILVAVGWQFVMHGRELRAYELFAMLTVLFAELLLREVGGRGYQGRRRYALSTLVAIASLTSYFFVLSLLAAMLWQWAEPSLRPRRRDLLQRELIGLIPFALWSPIMVHQYLGSRFSWIGPFTARGLLDTYWELFAHHVPASGVILPTLMLAAVIAGSLALARRSDATGRLIALLATLPVLVTALVWIGGAKVYDPRNLIAAGPFAAIALAQLPSLLPRPVGILAAAAATIAATVGTIVAEATPPTPYNNIATYLVREGWQPNDPILLFSDLGVYFAYRGPLEWYLPHDPYLGLGEPKPRAQCNALFVIAPNTSDRDGVERSGLLGASHTTGGVLVGQLTARRVPFARLWHATHILVGNARPACVRLVPESLLVAALRGTG